MTPCRSLARFARALLILGTCGLGLAGVPAQAQRQEALLAAATAEQAATLKTLERLVNVESGSGHAEGLLELGRLLEAELKALGAEVSRVRSAGIVPADNLVARLAGAADGAHRHRL